jgi:ABC-2 type transport system permease protein
VTGLRKYLVLSSLTMQGALAYRVRFLLSIGSGLVQALVLFYIWKAVYAGRSVIAGFSLDEMITYVFISFAVRNLYSFYTETGISSTIRTGDVAYELIKPFDYQLARFFESLGNVVIEGVLIGLTVLLVGVLAFGAGAPASLFSALMFVLSLFLSLLVNFALSYLVGLLSFYTTTSFGIVTAKVFIVGFFSGAVVPLAFFPQWLERIAYILPFYTIVHTPVLIYMGKIGGDRIATALATQLVWAALLWIGGRVMWSLAIRKVTIHGG